MKLAVWCMSMAALVMGAHAWADDYRVADNYMSQYLQLQGDRFTLESVSLNGHNCYAEGTLQGRGKQRFFQDEDGCRIDFRWQDQGIAVSAPGEACKIYCGTAATLEGVYQRWPASCSHAATAAGDRKFQQAYRGKRFAEAAAIKQQWLQQCGRFAHIVTLMRARNDLAVAYKNAGDKAACRQVLQSMRAAMEGRDDFSPSMHIEQGYERELKSARFNWRACQ